MKILKQMLLYTFLLIISIFNFACSRQTLSDDEPGQIYGLTIDDSWYDTVSVEDIALSLEKLKVKPTIRIVMSKDTPPKDYANLFKRLSKVAYIMALPVDSYEMNLYKDTESYRERFEEAKKYLSEYVDIWEIGNEINGIEWIRQDSGLIIKKIEAAYEAVKDTKAKVAVTFYYENPAYNRDMFEWIRKHFPKNLRKSIDYSLISYYEDDNEGYEPDWENVFGRLQKLFPDSKIGIGECGNIAADADEKSRISMINKYYTMPKYTENYIGGYFWWNYVDDCIPYKENKVYQAIYDRFK